MFVARNSNLNNLHQTICYITWILLLKLNCVHQNKHNAMENMSAHFLRFQNFEPRLMLEAERRFSYYPNETLMLNISTTSGHRNDNEQSSRYNFVRMEAPMIKRAGRGFHIQATDKDLTVETEFIIPFARIPIGWGSNFMKTSMRKVLNLHTGALLWSGAFVVVGAIVAGVVNTIIALKPALIQTAAHYRQQKRARDLALDRSQFYKIPKNYDDDFSTSFADLLDAKLHEHNLELKSCVQRSICRYIEKIENDARFGQASSSQKMLLGILSTQNLRRFMRGTAVYNAIEAGQNFNCENLKRRCHLPQLEKLFEKYSKS